MTRRTFLKSLGVASAGVAAGLSMLPTQEIQYPCSQCGESILTPNCGCDPFPKISIRSQYHGIEFRTDPNPLRFELIDGECRRAEWA